MTTESRLGMFAQAFRWLALALAFALTGCATSHVMMPTPVLYTGPNARPLLTDPPVDNRPPSLDLLFLTDRAPAQQADGLRYTAARSRSIAFGSATVEFGEGLSWGTLIDESTAAQRGTRLQLKLGSTMELGRFPPIPYEVAVLPDGVRRARAVVDAYEKAKRELQADIARRLTLAHRKEVVLFVHGYHSSFETAALTMGELCHFLGRDFVCGIFTWPAGGQGGGRFGYDVDRESSEYAIEDLVKLIRIIGRTPGVEKVHLIAHSRGTDTLASALAQLSAEAYTLRSSPEREFHIGKVVLIAPDLDGDVAVTKIFKVFSDPDLPFGGGPDPEAVIPPAPGLRVTLYVSPDDKAIAMAGWLFGSVARLGRLDATMFTPEQIEAIGMLRVVDIVEVRGTTDFFGHDYFVSNPQVSADIIAMLRYDLRPNEPGRPLDHVAGPFWRVPALSAPDAPKSE
ncbi:MAG TPA: alpha/beta hydrolase [Casimicrobiaceae bacterium]|nr:alpha/beta hydrolase [Casimicrobiaceae bacterium]